jgi:hypothetical protein
MFRYVLLALVVAIALACTEEGCDSHLDKGSCGTACCKLAVVVTHSPEKAVQMLNGTFHAGGPDNQYTAQMTAEGTSGFADLRQYKIDVDFIGQTYHVTDKGTYTDTQNWLVYSQPDGGSKIVGFSISQIGGAYGDDGQNWWNLNQIFKSVWPGTDVVHVDKSCMVESS